MSDSTKYFCEICKYQCSNRNNFKKHLQTQKHEMLAGTKPEQGFECSECGSSYKYKSGLSRHMKRCHPAKKDTETIKTSNVISDEIKQLIINQTETSRRLQDEMRQQQERHQEQLDNLIPKLQPVTNITNNVNKFNVNVFLNDECRDAVSIQNFIQTLQVGLKDLKYVGDLGFVDGMNAILSNLLGSMELYQRPMHCIDLKREVLYIKQGDRWEKDSDEKTELRKLIKAVEQKNYNNIVNWEKENPKALICDTPENDLYLKIMSETLGSNPENDDEENMSKIMKHIVKEVYINR